ncbi:MAG: energy-coupling factor ABC transporter ATP-binding protein [Humidesulfovibrio sp.]|nr:energy-coupling factor ABC transporter ATP-binding protein [Humidesulfovibrio sp.]
MSALYELRGIEAAYEKGENVLHVPQLDIARGEILGLAGHNGSGKSTLLKLLGFLLEARAGSLTFDGALVDRAALRSGHLLRRKAVLLGQETCLLKRSVAANVAYGLKLRGLPAPKELLARALGLVGLDYAQYGARPWRQLSGGEARRVALAARLALDPLALLLDEPTSGLDRASTEHVKRAVLGARENHGATLVIVSHDLTWLSSCADRVLTLDEGRIVNGL